MRSALFNFSFQSENITVEYLYKHNYVMLQQVYREYKSSDGNKQVELYKICLSRDLNDVERFHADNTTLIVDAHGTLGSGYLELKKPLYSTIISNMIEDYYQKHRDGGRKLGKNFRRLKNIVLFSCYGGNRYESYRGTDSLNNTRTLKEYSMGEYIASKLEKKVAAMTGIMWPTEEIHIKAPELGHDKRACVAVSNMVKNSDMAKKEKMIDTRFYSDINELEADDVELANAIVNLQMPNFTTKAKKMLQNRLKRIGFEKICLFMAAIVLFLAFMSVISFWVMLICLVAIALIYAYRKPIAKKLKSVKDFLKRIRRYCTNTIQNSKRSKTSLEQISKVIYNPLQHNTQKEQVAFAAAKKFIDNPSLVRQSIEKEIQAAKYEFADPNITLEKSLDLIKKFGNVLADNISITSTNRTRELFEIERILKKRGFNRYLQSQKALSSIKQMRASDGGKKVRSYYKDYKKHKKANATASCHTEF